MNLIDLLSSISCNQYLTWLHIWTIVCILGNQSVIQIIRHYFCCQGSFSVKILGYWMPLESFVQDAFIHALRHINYKLGCASTKLQVWLEFLLFHFTWSWICKLSLGSKLQICRTLPSGRFWMVGDHPWDGGWPFMALHMVLILWVKSQCQISSL